LEETLVKKDKKLTGKSSKAIAKLRQAGLEVQEQTGWSIGFIGGIPPRKK
jgi:hydroxymethylpyrimidine pyrophosphatase-like HAD family hydrolase